MDSYLDKSASLTPEARQIIEEGATEAPYSGKYNHLEKQGAYLCRRCGWALFKASSQFIASCGWPSFDEDIQSRVEEVPDADGMRTEIRCKRCQAHLGHVFLGEQYTPASRRYCVNSLAIDFVENQTVLDTSEAIVAGGCFWGVDYYLKQIPGVLSVEVGYTGGHRLYPTYQDICRGDTGHYEAARVLFDPKITSFKKVVESFFEIHDPTQKEGQGPDRGQQYQSVVFYYDGMQANETSELIQRLEDNGYRIATKVLPVAIFWAAEEGHQNYYGKHTARTPCHKKLARFAIKNSNL